MLRILLSVVATLATVFASYCIDGMYLHQLLLFTSGWMFCGICMMASEREV